MMGNMRKLMNPAFLAALGTLLVATAGLRAAIHYKGVYLSKLPIEAPDGMLFHTLPTSFGNWERIGADAVLTAEVRQELGTDNFVSRNYRRTDTSDRIVVELHCAYYTGMIDTVPHVPERCFVGGGLMPAGAARIVPVPIDLDRLSLDRDSDPQRHGGPLYTARASNHQSVRLPSGIERLRMNVSRFVDGRSGQSLYAGYFFIANGGVVPRAGDVRALAFNLTDDYAYYAKVQFTSSSVGSAEELAELAADMLNSLLPEIMRRVPDWVEVVEGRYPPDNPRRASVS
ncbi:MAG: exosortase-associated EpsI family protein [Phycisphaerales bacterium]|nr:MAG: exosortase-associated EpsI family protein [Phycisphaerales bacterium]